MKGRPGRCASSAGPRLGTSGTALRPRRSEPVEAARRGPPAAARRRARQERGSHPASWPSRASLPAERAVVLAQVALLRRVEVGLAPRAGRCSCRRPRARPSPRAPRRGATRAVRPGTPSRSPRRRGRSARRTRRPAQRLGAQQQHRPDHEVADRAAAGRGRPPRARCAPGDGNGHSTRAACPSSSTWAGPTLARSGRAQSAACSAATSSARDHGVGVEQQHVGRRARAGRARATLTPAANPPLRPGSR